MPDRVEVIVHKVMLYSPVYFAACAVGGALSCGLTHTLLTPMDLIKCNRQAYPQLFSGGAFSALRGLYHGSFAPFGWGQGLRALLRGWGPTAVGYSLQGAFKFGLYELCKQRLLLSLEPMQVARYRDLVYISSSAAAELVADVALCPLEAVKVRVQTSPTFARGLTDGLPRLLREEGVRGLYAGLVPLWARQVPYTVIKFLSFERVASLLFAYHPTPKQRMTAAQQLSVVFTAGCTAGVLCAVASHPADVLVSHLYKDSGLGGGLVERCRRVVGEVGYRGLWAGLAPRVLMVGTLTGLQWLIYGTFKAAVGLPTPGEVVEVLQVAH